MIQIMKFLKEIYYNNFRYKKLKRMYFFVYQYLSSYYKIFNELNV